MTPADHWDQRAAELDTADQLAHLRAEFHLPPGQIYFDGNSLGLLPRRAEQAVLATLAEWKQRAIGAWTDAEPPWFDLAERLAARMAPLVGAHPDEVVVANATTINLHQVLAALYRPSGARSAIAIDALAFPSNLHAVRSHLRLRGRDPERDVVVIPAAQDGLTQRADDIEASLRRPDVALAVLPAVVFHTGQLLDVQRLAACAADHGVIAIFDCSHSAGVLPHALHDWGVDAAVWCTYKYLNGGPGSVGAAFLHRRHFGATGLTGWFSPPPQKRFDWQRPFAPADGAAALQVSTPHVLSLAPLLGALEVVHEAGLERIRHKSLALTQLLMDFADAELLSDGFSIANPRADQHRGGHVALLHPEAGRICRALRARGVVPDYRPPSIVRLAPTALYNTFAEVIAVGRHLREVVRQHEFERFTDDPQRVP